MAAGAPRGLATALAATIVAIADIKLWRMDPDVPIFDVKGDGAYYLASFKGVVENGCSLCAVTARVGWSIEVSDLQAFRAIMELHCVAP